MTEQMYDDLKLACQEIDKKVQQERVLEVNDILEKQALPVLIEAVKLNSSFLLQNMTTMSCIHYGKVLKVSDNVLKLLYETKFYSKLIDSFNFYEYSYGVVIQKKPTP